MILTINMKTYQEFITEKVSNINYVENIFNNIINKIKKLNNNLTYDIEKGNIYWKLTVTETKEDRLMYVDEIKNLNLIIQILNNYNKELKKVGVILSYENNGFEIDIFYKDFILGRVIPNRYYYHVTQNNNFNNIFKEGLLPKINYQNYLSYPPAIFVSNDKYILYIGDMILRIDTEKTNNKWYNDINHEKGRYMTFEKIPPQAIEKVDIKTLVPVI